MKNFKGIRSMILFILLITQNLRSQVSDLSCNTLQTKINGKLVLSEISTDSKEAQFDLSTKLINGTYMVKVKLQDGSFDIHRIIISI